MGRYEGSCFPFYAPFDPHESHMFQLICFRFQTPLVGEVD